MTPEGFPLPTLLRLARLVAARLNQTVDILQTYCHHTLQNDTLSVFLPLFTAAGVAQVISASPLSMGLLRSQGGQAWHPASPELLAASIEAANLVTKNGTSLERVSLGFGFSSATVLQGSGEETPIVVGLSTPAEVHETMEIYTSIYGDGKDSRKGRRAGEGLGEGRKQQQDLEREVIEIFKKSNTLDWTWQCGAQV